MTTPSTPSTTFNVLITGASRGVGLAFVRQFVEWGDPDVCALLQLQNYATAHAAAATVINIIATCRSDTAPPSLLQLQKRAEERRLTATAATATVGVPHVHVYIKQLDVRSDHSIQALVNELTTNFQELVPLDLLINNAGITTPGDPHESLQDAKRQVLLELMDTNVAGPLSIIQSFAPQMMRSSTSQPTTTVPSVQSRIINVSSFMGSIASITSSDSNFPSYRCSKAALNMVTRMCASAFGPQGICVTSVHPGWVQTDMGGSVAPLSPADSVSSMLRTLLSLDMEQGSGRFYNYDGKEIPW